MRRAPTPVGCLQRRRVWFEETPAQADRVWAEVDSPPTEGNELRCCTRIPFLMVPWCPSQDVIGRITAVSDVIPVQSMYQAQPSDTRAIVLQDLLGNEMKLTLWGARAREFEAEQVYAAGETGAVIAIFLGVLPEMLQAVKSLGSSACCWYIDEDLPDINSFHASLGEEVAPVAVYTSMNQGLDATRVREAPVELTVQQLLGLDPFENRNKPSICNVSVWRLGYDQRWWFLSCGGCRKTAYVNGRQFRCSDRTCDSTAAEPVNTDVGSRRKYVTWLNQPRNMVVQCTYFLRCMSPATLSIHTAIISYYTLFIHRCSELESGEKKIFLYRSTTLRKRVYINIVCYQKKQSNLF